MRGMTMATLLALVVAACGSSAAGDDRPTEIVVSAASSLSVAFTEIETSFETANPGVAVVLNFGGSSALREQILAGADVDVFASADRRNMDAVGDLAVLPAAVFVANEITIGVPTGNPGGVFGLSDFARPELLIGICAEGVPCGSLARQVLADAGVSLAADTNELNVRSLVTKLEAGELDAGLVYVTDVASASGVDAIAIGEAGACVD